MDSITIVKNVTAAVVGVGVNAVVKNVIKNNATCVTVPDQIKVAVGTFVITAMIVSTAKKYADEQIDNALAWYEENKHNFGR